MKIKVIVLAMMAFFFQSCNEEKIVKDEGEDLKTEAQGISPSKAFTMNAVVYEGSFPSNLFRIRLAGTVGKLEVAWGDGSDSTFNLSGSGDYLEVAHAYKAPGTYKVSVTGDIHKIDGFYSYYGEGKISDINVKGLSNLKAFSYALSDGPAAIDFSRNSKLTELHMSAVNGLEQIKLPQKHNLRVVHLQGTTSMTGPAIDYLIDNVVRSAVSKGITHGSINLSDNWIPESGEPEQFIGPPSELSLEKLRLLRDNYQWEVWPNP